MKYEKEYTFLAQGKSNKLGFRVMASFGLNRQRGKEKKDKMVF